MNMKRCTIANAASAMFLLAALPVFADTGTVIDGSTGKPLPDVFVFATWEADVNKIVESSHTCFRVDLTQSDARGVFYISATSGNVDPRLSDRYRSPLHFYKPGYKGPEGEPKDGGVVLLMPDPRTGLKRLEDIGAIAAKCSCGNEEEQKAVLIPFRRSVYEESKGIAKTREEMRYVSNALFSLETLELGYRQAARNSINRERHEQGIK